jgi:glutathione synthase/RimK-type ligase-like ATP-grasp enzyme
LRIAVVTSENAAQLSNDDPILLAAIERAGHEAMHWCWDDPQVDWSSIDVTLIRSTWDYFQRPDEFRVWLASVEAQTKIRNPPAMLNWNFDKRYLSELAGAGVPVVPTEYVGNAEEVQAALERVWQLGHSAILKPVISGGSWGLQHLQPGEVVELDAEQAPWMVQPFISEIQSEGELAVIALGGEVHHGIRKRPKSGDFRVQAEFGGINTVEAPSEEAIALARQALAACPGKSIYARVDMVRRSGHLEIMEVELLDPELFLVLVPAAADRLVDCLQR